MTKDRAPAKRSTLRVWVAVLIWAYAGFALLRQIWLFGAFILGVVVYGRRPPAAADAEDEDA